jgi:hypothetical protein
MAVKDYYKGFTSKCQPQHLRLCYVYSDTIAKESATIAQWDEEETIDKGSAFVPDKGAFFNVQNNDWLAGEDYVGLRWAHLPLPSDFKDDAEKTKKPPLF